MQVKSFDHVHVYGADPDASAAFYAKHFDAKRVQRNAGPDGRTTVVLALGGRIVLVGSLPEGVAATPPPSFREGTYAHGFGIAHLGLRVDDVCGAVDELAAAGVTVLDGPHRQPGLTYAYVAAPDGVVVELTQYEVAGEAS